MTYQRERRHDEDLETGGEQPAPPGPASIRKPEADGADHANHDWSFQQYQSPPSAMAPPPIGSPKQAAKPADTVGGGTYEARPGELLKNIAESVYGHSSFWEDIAKANPRLDPGQGPTQRADGTLTLPELKTIRVMSKLEQVAPEALRDLAVSFSDDAYDTWLDDMSDADRAKDERLIQVVELMRGTGMTMDEMGKAQAEFIQDKTEDGQSLDDQLAAIEKLSAGRAAAPKVDENSDEEDRTRWVILFPDILQTVLDTAPPEVQAVIEEAKANGGGEVEYRPHMGDGTLARSDGKWNMRVGPAWLAEAKADPTSVHSTFLHEMKGHSAYAPDRWLSRDILRSAAGELADGDEQTLLDNASTLALPEGEIIAELYEWSLDGPTNASDHPFHEDPAGRDVTEADQFPARDDVALNLARIKETFAPKIGVSLVRALWRKIEADANILPQARRLFRKDVKHVFGVWL